MKRGEVWTVSGTGYAGKPRPAVIIQDDQFSATISLTICPVTSDETEAEFLRISLMPSLENGLRDVSRLMVDKLSTVPKHKLGRRIGVLNAVEMAALEGALMMFLGLRPTPTA